MFIRKKRNRSGTTTVVIVSKSRGAFKEIKNFGTAETAEEVGALYAAADKWLRTHDGQQLIDFDNVRGRERDETTRVVGNIEAVLINGTQLLLGRIYDSIGFNAVADDILRHLVIARISQPASKLATTAYLKSYYDEDIDLNRIYRYMDRLYDTQMEAVCRISVEHTRKITGGRIGLLFYDVTTLYFETSRTDELREPGYSKDGKSKESQVVLGLLVSEGGYPLAYALYNGKQYEGFTMLPVIESFKRRFNLGDGLVVVADSGLMSSSNLEQLRLGKYKYIIGARIKNSGKAVRQWILSQPKDGHSREYALGGGERLILGYSKVRADREAYNRKRGVERLRKAYAGGTLTKDKVNQRGYNKFLELSKDVSVAINEDKIRQDALWDGLKGYVTNTGLDTGEVIRQYHGLWVVERAFRISKGNLRMRPMFHFTPRRIEAHVCICFVAYKVYKELERIVSKMKIDMSVDRVLKVARTITTIRVKLPQSREMLTRTLFLTEEQQAIRPLLEDPLPAD